MIHTVYFIEPAGTGKFILHKKRNNNIDNELFTGLLTALNEFPKEMSKKINFKEPFLMVSREKGNIDVYDSDFDSYPMQNSELSQYNTSEIISNLDSNHYIKLKYGEIEYDVYILNENPLSQYTSEEISNKFDTLKLEELFIEEISKKEEELREQQDVLKYIETRHKIYSIKEYSKKYVQDSDDEPELFRFCLIHDKYNIKEGISNKLDYLFKTFFEKLDMEPGVPLDNTNLNQEILKAINDIPLKKHFEEKHMGIIADLENLLKNKDNQIYAYAITSSTNEILYYGVTDEIMQHRENKDDKKVIEEYLTKWNLSKVSYEGEYNYDLDVPYFASTEKQIAGYGFDTGFNNKDEPNNHLLIYCFGTHYSLATFMTDIANKITPIASHEEQ